MPMKLPRLYSILTTLLVLACLAAPPARAQLMPPEPAQARSSPDPIGIRSLDLTRRDLENLAKRHGLPPPGNMLITRSELGTYYFALLQKLSALPPEQMTNQDYHDIGLLSDEFDDVYRVIKGKLTLNVLRADNEEPEKPAIPQQMAEFADRFQALEKIKISGDLTFAPQNDFGKSVRMSMASNFRGRLNFTAKVSEGKDKQILGDGYLFARLTAASGRFFPRNKYLMSPENGIVDAVQSPFNSGLNDVQLANLIINNNNSNSIRPTVSMEQCYYTQDLRFGEKWSANYKAGLIYLGNMFDNNLYANNESLQFMNTSFVNSVSWRPNFVGPTFVLSAQRSIFKDKAFLRGTAAITSLTDRDYFGSVGGNYEVQLGHKYFKKEGNFRVGFWNFNFRGGSKPPFVTPSDISGTSVLSLLPGGTTYGSQPVGMYVNFDQKIWKDIGLWGRYAFNDKQFGEVLLGGLLSSRASWSTGIEIPAKIFFKRRTDDVLGIAYGQIFPYSREAVTPATPAFVSLNGIPATTLAQADANLAQINPGRHHRTEKIIEAYYRYQLNKNVSVSPDVQYYWSPGATGPQPGIFVLGTRLTVTF